MQNSGLNRLSHLLLGFPCKILTNLCWTELLTTTAQDSSWNHNFSPVKFRSISHQDDGKLLYLPPVVHFFCNFTEKKSQRDSRKKRPRPGSPGQKKIKVANNAAIFKPSSSRKPVASKQWIVCPESSIYLLIIALLRPTNWCSIQGAEGCWGY